MLNISDGENIGIFMKKTPETDENDTDTVTNVQNLYGRYNMLSL